MKKSTVLPFFSFLAVFTNAQVEQVQENISGISKRLQFEIDNTKYPALGYVPKFRLVEAYGERKMRIDEIRPTQTAQLFSYSERVPNIDVIGLNNNNSDFKNRKTTSIIRAKREDLKYATGKTAWVGGIDGGLKKFNETTANSGQCTYLQEDTASTSFVYLTCTPFEKDNNEIERETTEIDKDCPEISEEQIQQLCRSVHRAERFSGTNTGFEKFGFEYQNLLWKMSCANPATDSLEVARDKIQRMWLKYRESIVCSDYPNIIGSGKNITKLSLGSGFTAFVREAVRKYKLDMNFKDPKDNKTIMDFISDEKIRIQNIKPVNEDRLIEYDYIYNLLKNSGAKHAKDL